MQFSPHGASDREAQKAPSSSPNGISRWLLRVHPARFRLGPKCAVSADEASVIPGYTHSREDCHLRA
jgi:hypothetical protein